MRAIRKRCGARRFTNPNISFVILCVWLVCFSFVRCCFVALSIPFFFLFRATIKRQKMHCEWFFSSLLSLLMLSRARSWILFRFFFFMRALHFSLIIKWCMRTMERTMKKKTKRCHKIWVCTEKHRKKINIRPNWIRDRNDSHKS